jgi:hypothetical protein
VTEDDRVPRRDPVYEFQRWLMRNGAKSVGRELKGTVSRTFRGNRQEPGDIWETATSEPPPNVGEAPECAWCPVCRAARRFRDSGPGLASHMAGAGDALLSVAQDTLAAFEATLSARSPSGPKSPAGTGWPGEPDGHPADTASTPAPPPPTASAPAAPPPTGPRTAPAGPPAPTAAGPPPVAHTGPPPPAPVAHTGPPLASRTGPPPMARTGPPPAPTGAAGPAEAEPATGEAPAGVTETGPADRGPSGAGTGPADGT